MKQCPHCQTTYTDDSLQFCLADGTKLNETDSAAATVQMSFGSAPARINIPSDSAPTVFAAPSQAVNQPSAGKNFGLIITGILLLLMLLAGAGIGAFLMFRQSGNRIAAVNASPNPSPSISSNPSPAPTTAPSVNLNDETERLKEEMANLKKQMREQKKQNADAPIDSSASPNQSATMTARANSPKDGFLALRSEPNSETGYRVAKIPHGATLTVLGCPKPSNVGKMPGRWCQVVYNGESGWAFDGFMTF